MYSKTQNPVYNFTVVKNKNLFDVIEDRINSGHNGSTVIVPHVCNNVNAFGAGFAGYTANVYPEVKANFHLLGNQAKLGHTQFVKVKSHPQYKHSIVFANMIAQNKLISPSNPRPLNYAALVMSMTSVRTYIKNTLPQIDQGKIEIHAPKFGSGLAGGNWHFIADIITDIWNDIPVFIYTYK